MASSLDKLRADYAKISEENRKAYDALYSSPSGTGFSSSNSVNAHYENAVKNNKLTPEVKAEYDRLSAAYKKTQEAKNAMKAKLDAAIKTEDVNKNKGAKLKSAQVAADKAISDLRVAEAKFDSYNGQQNYITAYQKAQQANKDLESLGGKTVILPDPKVTIPPAGTKLGPDGKPQIDQSKIKEPTLTEIQSTLADPKNSAMLKDWQTSLKNNFGYKGNVDGKYSIAFQNALQNAYAIRASLPDVVKGAGFDSFVLHPTIQLKSSTGGGAGGGPTSTVYTTISNDTTLHADIQKMFQSELGRDVTTEELNTLMPLVKAAEAKNPTTYSSSTSGGKTVTKQSGGIDTTQFITDLLKSGASGKLPTLKDEYAQAKLTDKDMLARKAEKDLYNSAIRTGKDPALTSYGRGVSALADRIGMQVISSGAQMDKAEIDALAQEAYDKGADKDPYALQTFIDSKLKFGAGKDGNYTGQAGKYIADLTSTAAANGLDLTKSFGGVIQNWLTALQKGESIDTYKKIIRDTASLGMPEQVKKLMGNGVDLETIYSPYKQALASTLEINPETITLSDPTLRQAITPAGEMSIYDYTKQLRKDPRWQYTSNARGEVADITKQVLNDFGFQG